MAREEVIQELRWIKEGTVLSQEARNALDIAITALKSKYICEEIAFMCNLSGGADYFSAFEQLSKSLTKLNNTIEELNNQNKEPENHVRGLTSCRAPEDEPTDTPAVDETDPVSRKAVLDAIDGLDSVYDENRDESCIPYGDLVELLLDSERLPSALRCDGCKHYKLPSGMRCATCRRRWEDRYE